jgi:hypothetical protein
LAKRKYGNEKSKDRRNDPDKAKRNGVRNSDISLRDESLGNRKWSLESDSQ